MSKSLPPLTLILGGQRSGKSAYAESLFGASGQEGGQEGGVYLATGHATDPEMEERIEAHVERRGSGWLTHEEPLDLVAALNRIAKLHGDKPVLLDSLGMWVANMLHVQKAPVFEIEALASACVRHPGPVVAVSDEVGLGVIPMNEVARSYVDALGLVNQITAAHASRAVLVSAGLPLILKKEESNP